MYGEVGFERQPGFVILPNPIGYSGGQIDVAWQSALRDELGRLHRVVRSQLHWAPTDDFKNLDSLAEWVQRGEVWWACKPKWAFSNSLIG